MALCSYAEPIFEVPIHAPAADFGDRARSAGSARISKIDVGTVTGTSKIGSAAKPDAIVTGFCPIPFVERRAKFRRVELRVGHQRVLKPTSYRYPLELPHRVPNSCGRQREDEAVDEERVTGGLDN